MLNKSICMKCVDNWNWKDNEQWNRGIVRCRFCEWSSSPGCFGYWNSGYISCFDCKITSACKMYQIGVRLVKWGPPSRCPFQLEHLLSVQHYVEQKNL